MHISAPITLDGLQYQAKAIVIGDPANTVMDRVHVCDPDNGQEVPISPAEYHVASLALFETCQELAASHPRASVFTQQAF